MTTIRTLLTNSLDQRIEEVIKVNQDDQQIVYTELTEYVATDRIRDHYRRLFEAIAESKQQPSEGIGVWVSGFFGSGKSSFAKNLGYVLGNWDVQGTSSSELFEETLNDARTRQLLEWLRTNLEFEVIMFDVSVDNQIRNASENIAYIMYRKLLEHLGYATDPDIAELEIELEGEGVLHRFEELCQQHYGKTWVSIRKTMQKYNRASALLHELDPQTYETKDSWVNTIKGRNTDITVAEFVARAFDLTSRRRPGKVLVYIIDEVGQYVSRSAKKIENLRAIVEQFGKEGRNRRLQGHIEAPAWIVVTSQEKLNEVVDAIGERRVELAKMQDRFPHRVDLLNEDIREVATRRVLEKTEPGKVQLEALYQANHGQLNAACRLVSDRTRNSQITLEGFIQFYPYLPHYIDMSIDIMSGLRTQGSDGLRHMGGSNRTIIKQVFEMLVHERTQLASQPIGTLVTLDRVYELVEGNLDSERQRDIADIKRNFPAEEGGAFALRVAKTVALMQYVPWLPRTIENIAVLLVDQVGMNAPVDAVTNALTDLEKRQYVRHSEDGWKLQTAQEKAWETERRGISPTQRDLDLILQGALRDTFSDGSLRTINYNNLRTFRIGTSLEGKPLGEEGNITLVLHVADTPDDFAEVQANVERLSRSDKSVPYWVLSLTSEINDLMTQLHATREMINKYDRRSVQGSLSTHQANSLAEERNRQRQLERRLRDKMAEAFTRGNRVFAGVMKPGANYGSKLVEIVRAYVNEVIPTLYGKLEVGARPLDGKEAEHLLRAADLKALPSLLYDHDDALGLIVRDGANYVLDQTAEIAAEVLNYLNNWQRYGETERLTGKSIETHFGGLGYGWERDMLRLVLAALFRAGAIEVAHKGRIYKNYRDPQSHEPFTKNPAFGKAKFTPVKQIDRKTLIEAAEVYERLTGREVDIERTAIDDAVKSVVSAELTALRDLIPVAQARGLPFAEDLAAYRDTLDGLNASSADEAIQGIINEGDGIKEKRAILPRLQTAVSDTQLANRQAALTALGQMWPVLSNSASDELHAAADQLREALAREDYYDHMDDIMNWGAMIAEAYDAVYTDLHQRRHTAYTEAIDEVRNHPDWPQIPVEAQSGLLRPLDTRLCDSYLRELHEPACVTCRATPAQMSSDLDAVHGRRSDVLVRLQEMAAPQEQVERVRVSGFFRGDLSDPDAVQQSLEELRAHLLDLIDRGVKVIIE